MSNIIPRVRPGQAVSAEVFNALVDAVNRLAGVSAAGALAAHEQATGVHLAAAPRLPLRLAELAEDIGARDADKTGHVLDYDSALPGWVDTTADSRYSAQTVARVTDPFDAGIYLAEERRLVTFEPESGKHLPLAPPGPHLGVAEEDVARESVGAFAIYRVDSGGSEVDATLEVNAHNWLFPKIFSGAPCLLSFHPQSRRWYVSAAYSATRITGLAVGDITGAGTLDTLTPLDGHYPIASTATTLAVANPHGFEVDDDALVRTEWNDQQDQWEIYQATCPEL